ncbi:MAG: folylpolyglutamate synthase/dihydrofolate synthase family protein [Planctomycetota bacterium]|nr:folylpolyglutamate synthase/dihydrofolate synthase family protein [Planctomycetota bacterium]
MDKPDSSPGLTPMERVFQRVNYEQKTASIPGREFKLDTIRIILERLGDPHSSLQVIHIAGTKGKGSTANFVSRIGQELGLKTAIYCSPHFERYTERFSINNREVSEETLQPVLSRILQVVEELDREIERDKTDLRPATFFDITTAAAFLLFAEQGVELVALEVGLGGRLDSTNVCQPMATVITSISLDHTRQLGNTTAEIAAEKAGIIKSSVPAICGRMEPAVEQVIRHQAEKSGASPLFSDQDFQTRVTSTSLMEGSTFDYIDPNRGIHYSGLQTPVAGIHQVHNAGLAIKALLEALSGCLRSEPLPPEDQVEQAVRKGLLQTRLQGRLEIASRDPLFLLDMAHNEASISAMIDSLSDGSWLGKPRSAVSPGGPAEGKTESGTGKKSQALFSCSRDKDHLAMLKPMVRFFDRLILTGFQSNPRARDPHELLEDLRQNVENLSTEVVVIPDPEQALKEALRAASAETGDTGLSVVCGSIFLVGELQVHLRKQSLFAD